MYFKDIIGQEELKEHLRQTVREGSFAHAQLFCGPEGVGKLALALAYARYIHCTKRNESDACGTCPSCLKINKLQHPDLHFVFPIAKIKSKEVCDDYLPEWRSFLLENTYFNLPQWLAYFGADNAQGLIYAKESDEIIRKLSLKAYESIYKIMLIWLPERMHDVCANKLLKVLEEPPQNTLFLLVSNQPDQILGTIQSRSQIIRVRPLPAEDITLNMMEKYALSEPDARSVAHIANGDYLKALQTIRLSEENQVFFEYFIALMRLAYGRKLKELKAWSEEVAGIGRERQKEFLAYCQRMIRENFIYNMRLAPLNYMNNYEENFSTRFSPFINERNTYAIMEELSLAEAHVAQNVNGKMVFFDLAIKMIMLLKNQ